MIKIILDLLRSDEWINQSEAIDMAKGKYELPRNMRELKNKIGRQWQSKR